jgi:hypothetical protein
MTVTFITVSFELVHWVLQPFGTLLSHMTSGGKGRHKNENNLKQFESISYLAVTKFMLAEDGIAFNREESAMDQEFGINIYHYNVRIIKVVLFMLRNETDGLKQGEEVYDGDQEDAVNVGHIHLQPMRKLAFDFLRNSHTVKETPSGFDKEQTLRIGTRLLQLVLNFLDRVQSRKLLVEIERFLIGAVQLLLPPAIREAGVKIPERHVLHFGAPFCRPRQSSLDSTFAVLLN